MKTIRPIKNSGFSLSEVEKFIEESYKSGYDAKDEEIKSRRLGLFTDNIILTNQVTEDLLAYLEKLNIYPVSAYLKIDSIVSFHIIFTAELNDYISEKLLIAYDWISDTEKKIRNINYNIDLSFMHEDENLNMERLNSDGFRFKHKRLSEK